MSQQPAGKPKRGLPPIVFILIGLGALWGLQSHWAKLLGWRPSLPTISGVNTTSGVNSMLPGGSGAGGNLAAQFPPQQSVPAGTTITIDESGIAKLRLISPTVWTPFDKSGTNSLMEAC